VSDHSWGVKTRRVPKSPQRPVIQLLI
jgi:hypothetical protein